MLKVLLPKDNKALLIFKEKHEFMRVYEEKEVKFYEIKIKCYFLRFHISHAFSAWCTSIS